MVLDKGMLGGSLNCAVINMHGLSSNCISRHEVNAQEGVLMFDLVSPCLNMSYVQGGERGHVSTLSFFFFLERKSRCVFITM